MSPGHVQPRDQRDGNEEHEGVRGDVETGLDDGVVLESGALWVWWWHRPVALEWCAGCEKGDFCGDPAASDVDGEVEHHALDVETESQARVHEKHAGFDGVDDVEHCLYGILISD